jgi:hypothetical protein
VIDEEKMHVLTEICGMPGYMAPEIFLRCACLFCLFSSSPCVHACVLLQVSCLYPGRRDFFSFLGFWCSFFLSSLRLHDILLQFKKAL